MLTSHFCSTFVGLFIMIVLLPVPGYVAKLVQEVQKDRMKMVHFDAASDAPSLKTSPFCLDGREGSRCH